MWYVGVEVAGFKTYSFDEDGSLNDDTSTDLAPAHGKSDEMDIESVNNYHVVGVRSSSAKRGLKS